MRDLITALKPFFIYNIIHIFYKLIYHKNSKKIRIFYLYNLNREFLLYLSPLVLQKLSTEKIYQNYTANRWKLRITSCLYKSNQKRQVCSRNFWFNRWRGLWQYCLNSIPCSKVLRPLKALEIALMNLYRFLDKLERPRNFLLHRM